MKTKELTQNLVAYQAQITEDMTRQPWLDGKPAHVFHLTNAQGMSIAIMDVGATWLSCSLAMPQGKRREVLLRARDMQAHLKQGAYLGAVVGRYANRIGQGGFSLNNARYALADNEGDSVCLHGGEQGFDKKRWQLHSQSEQQLTLSLVSEDKDQGFPGKVNVLVTYRLHDDHQLSIEYNALCDQACPLNLTNHAYFNLAGESSGKSALEQYLCINGDHYLPINHQMLPLGELNKVENTGFDFRATKRISTHFLADEQQKLASGYDHCWQLNQDIQPQLKLVSSEGDLSMTMSTTQPGVQFYSGNFLSGVEGVSRVYENYAGVALETQFFPDGPNHPEWGKASGIFAANEPYQHSTHYCFALDNALSSEE